MKYSPAPEIKKTLLQLINQLELKHIKKNNIHCIRSFDAKTRAVARIWGMAKLFKEVVGIEPHYIIEVNAKRFDKLPEREKIKTLIHELMHIPKTFSGALLSHRGKGRQINDQQIERILKDYLTNF
ncbi:metallopeptidase [Candidatus Roizmanbacteria bacterium CG02_land_8_20_14_3_00_36_15]|uniref:Metallopeptidase n=1 Tax=Candidatus Roizmanbacteria bacterium CG10_big_fil_rev_8_21_14_0_10_36_26 TaxID=1974851 RepID=A0A2M8KME9_9BACT|nr:MAG: metallopeptidase [Candidatus Roizmanbacteria bacterium CG03_land_8_20_14_0_80_36_21]PIV38023.1 MAG: metallopeptidase [Candidatus Roizmanbacteria bacterium CG02_land_8_20_14_3_00_36_15]PIY69739.1 MAG: metallopeptidase [Candidatus Roizmanbacteria bacterium CG_4_10_14_0_8_um_filter_36_36]PJA52925.1 MAG: metallopeptidase [Candidatus Roizmanbacteria bacterium CG_4_9_14_3_um_filter_36_11]PJE61089.1 MAG: metallopeptidase [Candidatus Roizmanbacteria bacterium CG10_big_fil_rev_8_21_14_0_10_36_26